MRCLALANMVVANGGRAHFVWREATAEIIRRVERAGHAWSAITITVPDPVAGACWDSVIDDLEVQTQDARCTLAVAIGIHAQWIVVDHYGLDRNWEAIARHQAQVLVVDDLANRQHDCEILLDQTYGRDAAEYRDLVPRGCNVLAGSRYALLRPEFAAAREESLARRQVACPVERILISLGMTDPDGSTALVLARLMELNGRPLVDVVTSSASPAFARVTEMAARFGNVTVHQDVDGMAELMLRADLAIGAAGSSSWERCCLGLPSLALVLAKNQSLIATQLENAGAHFSAPDPTSPGFSCILAWLLEANSARTIMSRRAAAIVDGRGCQRVFDAMQADPARKTP